MTDEEFDLVFKQYTDTEILIYLGRYSRTVITNNGNRYHIENLEDLRAVVEQERYQSLTGRE